VAVVVEPNPDAMPDVVDDNHGDLVPEDLMQGDLAQADTVKEDVPPGDDAIQDTDPPKKPGGCSASTSTTPLALCAILSAILLLAALRRRGSPSTPNNL